MNEKLTRSAMIRLAVHAAVLIMLSSALSCSSASPVTEEQVPAQRAADPDPAELIGWPDDIVVDPEWLEANLRAPDLVTIHVGVNDDAWGESHIPGQIYIEFETIVDGTFEEGFWLPDLAELRQTFEDAGVGDDQGVVLTGDLDGLTATRALLSLEVLGRDEGVALLDGGLAQWREDDRPLSDTPAEPSPATLTTAESREMIVEADEVLEMLEDPGFQLVDARPHDQFSGEVAGDGVKRAGHIPGAVNIFWKDVLRADDRPLLMPTDDITAIYDEAGVDNDQTIVAYCRTGVQASFGYFLGRLLDREVLIYDGSFVDWTQDDQRPINTLQ